MPVALLQLCYHINGGPKPPLPTKTKTNSKSMSCTLTHVHARVCTSMYIQQLMHSGASQPDTHGYVTRACTCSLRSY